MWAITSEYPGQHIQQEKELCYECRAWIDDKDPLSFETFFIKGIVFYRHNYPCRYGPNLIPID